MHIRHIRVVTSHIGIECDRANPIGIEDSTQPILNRPPPGIEIRETIDLGIIGRDQRRLIRQIKRDVHDPLLRLLGQMHHPLAGLVFIGKLGELTVQCDAARKRLVDDLVRLPSHFICRTNLRLPVTSKKMVGYLPIDQGINGLEILDLNGHFLGEPVHELKIAFQQRALLRRTEIIDLRSLGLPVTIDAADALFKPRRIEGHIEIHQTMAIRLQIDPLTSGVRSQQHTNRLVLRIGIEPCTDQFAFLRVGLPIDHGKTIFRVAA